MFANRNGGVSISRCFISAFSRGECMNRSSVHVFCYPFHAVAYTSHAIFPSSRPRYNSFRSRALKLRHQVRVEISACGDLTSLRPLIFGKATLSPPHTTDWHTISIWRTLRSHNSRHLLPFQIYPSASRQSKRRSTFTNEGLLAYIGTFVELRGVISHFFWSECFIRLMSSRCFYSNSRQFDQFEHRTADVIALS